MTTALWNGKLTLGPSMLTIRIVPGEHDSTPKYTHVQECCDTKIKATCGCGRGVTSKRYTAPDGKVYAPPALSKPPVSRETIAVGVFDHIDPTLLGKTYTVVPHSGSEQAYATMNAALNRTGKTVVTEMTFRSKRRHFAIRGGQGTMVAQEIKYSDDVLDLDPSDEWAHKQPSPSDVDAAVAMLEEITSPTMYEPIRNPQLVEMEDIVAHMRPESEPSADTTAPVDLLAAVAR